MVIQQIVGPLQQRPTIRQQLFRMVLGDFGQVGR